MNGSGFFAMGGYAVYVWPCFLLTVIVLVWNAVAARRLHAKVRLLALRKLDADGDRR